MTCRTLRVGSAGGAGRSAGLQQLLEASLKCDSGRPCTRWHALRPRRVLAAAAAAGQQAGPLAAGQELELECTDLAFGGEGVCRLPDGMVVFVARALPGERLRARVVQAKPRFAKACKLETLRPHAAPAEPVCQHFGPCGGCSLQSLQYEAQLAAKQRQVADLLRRTAGVPHAEQLLLPPLGCPPGRQYGYRNKMEFSFAAASSQHAPGSKRAAGRGSSLRGGGRGRQAGGGPGLCLGLKRPGSHSAVLPIERCHLQADAANQLLRRVLSLCEAHGLRAHDPAARTGLLQHVVLRRSSPGGAGGGRDEFLVNFVTAGDGRVALEPVAAALMGEVVPAGEGLPEGPARQLKQAPAPPAAQRQQQQQPPPPQQQRGQQQAGGPMPAAAAAAAAVVGVVNSVSQRGRPAGERRLAAEHVLAGRGHLIERLCGLDFEVSANSFFQTNTQQAEVLYNLVAAAAQLRPGDALLDLYCGTGTIGLALAARCAEVRLHGVELSAAAVRDARRNAARNGIADATFIQGDLHKLQLEGRLPRPDVVVVDPARSGLSPAVVAYLRACRARRLVYVSCNAATQARDISLLCAGEDGGGDGGGADGGGGGAPFRLASVQAVDMYPQTAHVETVAVLEALQGGA